MKKIAGMAAVLGLAAACDISVPGDTATGLTAADGNGDQGDGHGATGMVPGGDAGDTTGMPGDAEGSPADDANDDANDSAEQDGGASTSGAVPPAEDSGDDNPYEDTGGLGTFGSEDPFGTDGFGTFGSGDPFGSDGFATLGDAGEDFCAALNDATACDFFPSCVWDAVADACTSQP